MFMLLFVQNCKYLFLVGNINYPNIAYFLSVFGFEIEGEFPVHVYHTCHTSHCEIKSHRMQPI